VVGSCVWERGGWEGSPREEGVQGGGQYSRLFFLLFCFFFLDSGVGQWCWCWQRFGCVTSGIFGAVPVFVGSGGVGGAPSE